jgi:prepilin-type N-terminal cleavage/methylation domain-containing protein
MSRKAFSLLELIIVVMIISISYMLVFSSMQKESKAPKALTPLNLKSTLLENNITGTREFICINNAKECFIHQDGTLTPYINKIALKDISVYKIDGEDNSYKVDYGRYDDNKISLRFSIYSNSSSTQMIIRQNKNFFYLPTYFGDVIKVSSLDEAKKLWIDNTQLIRNSGDFY